MPSREEALNLILEAIKPGDLVVACNGKIGRELFELRKRREEPNEDFILVGAMGRALAVALGIALNTKKRVFCILGDGNFLMGLGTLATVMEANPTNLKVYILNNDAHDSTGGQPTAFSALSKIFLPGQVQHYPLIFKVIDVPKGARHDLGRPTDSPAKITEKFFAKCRR